MSVHGGVARDDRTWPRWAGAFSALARAGRRGRRGLGGRDRVAGPGGPRGRRGSASSSRWRGRLAVPPGVPGAARRRPAAGRGASLVQLVLVLVGFVALSYDPRLGTALLAALFGAMFAVNLWAMRAARGNRAAVDAQEARGARRSRARSAQAVAEAPVRDSLPPVDVGAVLDTAWRDVGRRWVAWLVAGAAVAGAAALLTDSGPAVFMVLFLTGAVLLWVGRAAWSVGLARRDFRAARTAPERAWVVLLHDPTPRMIRPLLGVWAEEPVVRRSVFPRPDVVFRCDDDLDDLLSHQGEVAVHEAWVDTSRRGIRGARWVAADAGVALPHRRALLGRWFFSSLTRAERPACRARSARRGPVRTPRVTPRCPRRPGPRAGDPAAVAGRCPRGVRGGGAAPRVRLRRPCAGRWPSRRRTRPRGCRGTRRGRPRCRC